jgi:hypothetical protein
LGTVIVDVAIKTMTTPIAMTALTINAGITSALDIAGFSLGVSGDFTNNGTLSRNGTGETAPRTNTSGTVVYRGRRGRHDPSKLRSEPGGDVWLRHEHRQVYQRRLRVSGTQPGPGNYLLQFLLRCAEEGNQVPGRADHKNCVTRKICSERKSASSPSPGGLLPEPEPEQWIFDIPTDAILDVDFAYVECSYATRVILPANADFISDFGGIDLTYNWMFQLMVTQSWTHDTDHNGKIDQIEAQVIPLPRSIWISPS